MNSIRGIHCFLYGLIIVFGSCTSSESDDPIIPFTLHSEKARNLYLEIENHKNSDLYKTKELAIELSNISDCSDCELLGEFYVLLADHLYDAKSNTVKELGRFYESINGLKRFDAIKVRIDFILLRFAIMHQDEKSMSEILDRLENYINEPEFLIEKMAFQVSLSRFFSWSITVSQDSENFEFLIDKLDSYEWSVYNSIIYRNYISLLHKEDDKPSAIKFLYELIDKNVEHGLSQEVIECHHLLSGFYEDYRVSEKDMNSIQALDSCIILSKESGFCYLVPESYRVLGHYYSNRHMPDEAYREYNKAIEWNLRRDSLDEAGYDRVFSAWAFFQMDEDNHAQEVINRFDSILAEFPEDEVIVASVLTRKSWLLDITGRTTELQLIKDQLAEKKQIKSSDLEFTEELRSFYNFLSDNRFSFINPEFDKLSLENELKDEHIFNQRIMLYLVAATCLILFLLFCNYRRKVNFSKEVQLKNQIIENKNLELNKYVTALEINQDELKGVLDQREKVINRLRGFASMIAHDFKEPIRTVFSFGQILESSAKKNFDEKDYEKFKHISKGVHRMNAMVDRLYQYSKNTLTILGQFDVVELNTLVKDVLVSLETSIEEKEVKIIVGELGAVSADEILLIQLFQNLISNSIKYSTPNKEVRIEINTISENDILTISISDNGIGISTDEGNEIFDLFNRSVKTESTEGLGIGLATCREVVELHDGEIWYESVLGEGTTFFFTLPKS